MFKPGTLTHSTPHILVYRSVGWQIAKSMANERLYFILICGWTANGLQLSLFWK